MKWNI